MILPENAKAHYLKKRKESLRLGSNVIDGGVQHSPKLLLPKTRRNNPLGRLHRSTNGRIRDTE